MKKFHVVLIDSERDVTGYEAMVVDGALVIRNSDQEAVVVYASGEWKLCETESRDDR